MICLASLASMFAVSIRISCLKPCKVLYKMMASRSLLFIIDNHNLHMTSTRPIHLYSPPPLGNITIIVHASAIGMCHSQNSRFVTLISFFHCLVSRSFSRVSSLSQTSKLSALIPYGSSARPVRSICTTIKIPPFRVSVLNHHRFH